MQFNRLIIIISFWLTGQSVLSQGYEPPRTESGKPDLQGYWTNASITTMQRSRELADFGLTIPFDEVARLTNNNHQNVRQATDDNQVQGQLPDGTDLARGRGYNAFWVDPGTQFGNVRGEYRSSWITFPDDGRIPYSEQGNQQRRAAYEKFSGYGGPEGAPLAERCLIGFGSTSGPPMNSVLYNNMYQIVQTEDYVMILVEMVHDARVIPINGDHRPKAIEQWMGDSIAWWDGDTLVVETVNLHPQQKARMMASLSDQGRIIEKFTRYSDQQIFYEFEVIDPVFYTESWGGEISFNSTETKLYEYACHEGNYGLQGILGGYRRQEMDAEAEAGS
tara:strand:+ start:1025 stop:2026 length:1002 start_codon:yes stop_codon:yes gene_type:complete